MQSFTNKFSIAMNPDKTEVILDFFQNVPVFENDDVGINKKVDATMQKIPVANLVMSGTCARNLADVLLKMFEEDPTN